MPSTTVKFNPDGTYELVEQTDTERKVNDSNNDGGIRSRYAGYWCGWDSDSGVVPVGDSVDLTVDDAGVVSELLAALKDLASESKETFAHWPDLKAQVEGAIAKAEGQL